MKNYKAGRKFTQTRRDGFHWNVSVIKPPPANAIFLSGLRPFIRNLRNYKLMRVIKVVWADSRGGRGGDNLITRGGGYIYIYIYIHIYIYIYIYI